jgi:hypothetical protein
MDARLDKYKLVVRICAADPSRGLFRLSADSVLFAIPGDSSQANRPGNVPGLPISPKVGMNSMNS